MTITEYIYTIITMYIQFANFINLQFSQKWNHKEKNATPCFFFQAKLFKIKSFHAIHKKFRFLRN